MLEVSAKPTDRLDVCAYFGYTDSEIPRMQDACVVGNPVPRVSKRTFNAGTPCRQPLSDGRSGSLRLDFQRIGGTCRDPYNVTSRDRVSLLNLRLGLEAEKWSLTAWSKNLADRKYNAEFSPGGFLWKALPRRYGLDLSYRF